MGLFDPSLSTFCFLFFQAELDAILIHRASANQQQTATWPPLVTPAMHSAVVHSFAVVRESYEALKMVMEVVGEGGKKKAPQVPGWRNVCHLAQQVKGNTNMSTVPFLFFFCFFFQFFFSLC